MERLARGYRREAGVDSRDEVRHSEKTDQLFVKLMKADGKGCISVFNAEFDAENSCHLLSVIHPAHGVLFHPR